MKVRDVMTKKVVCCTPSDTAEKAANLMRDHNVGAIPVVSDLTSRRLEGILTDRDLCCRIVAESRLADTMTIGELMTRSPVTCKPEDALDTCLEAMQEHHIRRIPIVDEKASCVGIVAEADIALRASAAKVGKTVAEISRPLHAKVLSHAAATH
jgi:CBS domain-containing protein